MSYEVRTPRSVAQATADYKGALASGNSMLALECLQDLMYHKVGDITEGLTDTQMAQMMEMEFGCNMQAIVMAAISAIDDESNSGLVNAVEKGISNKATFFTQKAEAGATSALSDLDVSDSVRTGILSSVDDLTAYAETGATKSLAKVDFKSYAASGVGDALAGFDFKTPAKIGALNALGTYDFVASAKEGAKLAIEDKRAVTKSDSVDACKGAISQSESAITGYAQSAIDNKKDVIIAAAEQAIENRKVSTQEEVRTAILSAYSAYALALDSAKASFEEVISKVVNQTIKLNDATVQYQVLLLSASKAAERLSTTAETFKDAVFTAERYASTVTDVLAIQQLQKSVLDTTMIAINEMTQLRAEWADDRKELYDTMADVKKLQDIETKFDMAYKSLDLALGLTERVQEGIKMKSPEVVY